MNAKGKGNLLSSEETNDLTVAHSMDTLSGMAGYFQVGRALRTQFDVDRKELERMRSEQESLRAAYLRFADLQSQVAAKERRLLATGALLAHSDEDAIVRELSEVGVNTEKDWRKRIEIWRLIMEIARQFQKTQVVEVCHTLYQFGYEITRAGVESALRTHAKRFRITRRGREKYVSLK